MLEFMVSRRETTIAFLSVIATIPIVLYANFHHYKLSFCRQRWNLRVWSVSLGVNSSQVPTLLDVDVQAAADHVVDEAELQVSLDCNGSIPPLTLTVNTGHWFRPEKDLI